MTRVDGPQQPTWRGGSAPEDGALRRDARRDRAGNDGSHTASFGQGDAQSPLMDWRGNAFRERMQLELRKDEPGSEDMGHMRLLAQAGPAQPYVIEGPGGTLPMTADLAADRADRLGTLAQRIEEALAVEPVRAAAGTFTVRLTLDDADSGIAAVSVVMEADAIHVVLTRAQPGGEMELAALAQLLADRLQARFARRVVRVLEAEPVPQNTPSSPMQEISRLLGDRGDP